MFLAALRGEHRLQGFRNQDIARRLYPQQTKDKVQQRRRCGRVTRLIQLLRAHGLVAKIPRSRRYRVTAQGELLMSAAIKVKPIASPADASGAKAFSNSKAVTRVESVTANGNRALIGFLVK